MLSLLVEQTPQFDLYAFLQVTGTPGTMLVIAVMWWKTIGKDQAEERRKTAEALQRTAVLLGEVTSGIYRYCDRTEKQQDKAEAMLSHQERLVERIESRIPKSGLGHIQAAS